MLLVAELIALGWGIRMIFRKSEEGWGLDNWVGVMMVVGVLLVHAVMYWVAHQDPYY